jgi:hypothetical protein
MTYQRGSALGQADNPFLSASILNTIAQAGYMATSGAAYWSSLAQNAITKMWDAAESDGDPDAATAFGNAVVSQFQAAQSAGAITNDSSDPYPLFIDPNGDPVPPEDYYDRNEGDFPSTDTSSTPDAPGDDDTSPVENAFVGVDQGEGSGGTASAGSVGASGGGSSAIRFAKPPGSWGEDWSVDDGASPTGSPGSSGGMREATGGGGTASLHQGWGEDWGVDDGGSGTTGGGYETIGTAGGGGTAILHQGWGEDSDANDGSGGSGPSGDVIDSRIPYADPEWGIYNPRAFGAYGQAARLMPTSKSMTRVAAVSPSSSLVASARASILTSLSGSRTSSSAPIQ